jgi:hypothetical protein
VQFPLFPFHPVTLGLRYFPQHPILEHPEATFFPQSKTKFYAQMKKVKFTLERALKALDGG